MNAERTSQPSADQVETLIDFLERKPRLAKGFPKNLGAKQAASKEWDRIILKLNSMGGGTVKTAKKWIKYWSDKKGAVKKKAAARAAFRSTTGLGMVEGDMPELSNIEERILMLMGGERFATGDTHLQIQPLNEPSQESSPSIVAPVAQSSSTCTNMPDIDECLFAVPGTSALVDPVINTADMDFSLGHRAQSEFRDNLLGPETEVATTTSPTRPNESFTVNITNQHLTPAIRNQQKQSVPTRSTTEQQFPPTTRPSSSRLTSPRRPRRRILQATRRSAQESPPSQRRSNLIGMADKFLQIEQQRLDLDSRMLALMEGNSERDHLLVGATKAVGQGLKALADALHQQIPFTNRRQDIEAEQPVSSDNGSTCPEYTAQVAHTAERIQEITLADHVCHACWQLVTHPHLSDNAQRKRVGHQSVCVVCGRSILRLKKFRILFEEADEEEQRVANTVSTWIQPRELCSEDKACLPCWLRAKRAKTATPVQDDHVDGDQSLLMCAVCGRSLLVSTTDEECNPENNARVLEHQQLSRDGSLICHSCWVKADRAAPSDTSTSANGASEREGLIQSTSQVTLQSTSQSTLQVGSL